MRRRVSLGICMLLSACARRDERGVVRGPVAPSGASCPIAGAPRAVGTVTAPELVELSGLAASARHAGVFWTHNDSGDSARVFALDASGAVQAEVALTGVTATDFEDIAVAPCEGTSCVYVADIGDNRGSRAEVAVHRFREPAVLEKTSVPVVTARFRYEDGPRNAESLLVDPRDGSVFVVSKAEDGPSGLYRVPPEGGVARRETSLAPPLGSNRFTAGAVSRSVLPGLMIVLRTYTHAFAYPLREDEPFAVALTRPPCNLPAPSEPQGEAIAFSADGRALRFVSEGERPALYEVALSAPSP